MPEGTDLPRLVRSRDYAQCMFGLREKSKMIDPERALPGRDWEMPVADRHAVLGTPMKGWPGFDTEGFEQIVVGMGCFWGAERVFWTAPGVYTTAVGYAGGYTPNPSYEEVCSGSTGQTEAVLVVFDPARTSYAEMLKLFWENHDPTQGMRQGNDMGTQYRSAIYWDTDEHRQLAEASRARLQRAAQGQGISGDHDRDRQGRPVLLRRGRPPAVPAQEPVGLLWTRWHRRQLPGRGSVPSFLRRRRSRPRPPRSGSPAADGGR